MVAFFASLLALVVLTAIPFAYGKRRPIGTPVTWGEAMGGALFLFFVMFFAYGVVPHQFLSWADGPLKWRADAYGIPAGPLRAFVGKKENHFYSHKTNAFWPSGITFGGRGRVKLTKEGVRDIVAATLYIVFLSAHIAMWSLFQKRDKKAKSTALDTTSTYGRPLVRKA